MSLKRVRCSECQSTFYTTQRVTKCDTCEGVEPNFEQAEKDAAIVKKVNRRRKLKEPQQVDPRAAYKAPQNIEDQSEDD